MKWKYDLHDSEMWLGEEFDTKEEAIKEGISELNEMKHLDDSYKGKLTFRVGQQIDYNVVIDEETFIEKQQEDAFEQCGEISESWLENLSGNQKERLQEKLGEAFYDWLKEIHEIPEFGTIENIEEIDVRNYKK